MDTNKDTPPKLVTLKVLPEDRAWFLHAKADTRRPVYIILNELIERERKRKQEQAQ